MSFLSSLPISKRSFTIPDGLLKNASPKYLTPISEGPKISKSISKISSSESETKIYIAKGTFSSGLFSKVYLANLQSNERTNEYVVIKSLNDSTSNYERAVKEKYFLNLLKHSQFFPMLYDYFVTSTDYNLVLSCATGGDFFQYFIEDFRELDDVSFTLCIAELLSALNYMHLRNMLHLDIKLENTLISNTGHVVITDFDLSIMIEDAPAIQFSYGTLFYKAPEIMRKKMNYTFAADHWSLGIMLYQMITRQSPYEEEVVTYEITKEKKFEFPADLSLELQTLMRRLLETSPYLRLGRYPTKFYQIKCLDYFEGINWQQIADGTSRPPFFEVPVMTYEKLKRKLIIKLTKN